MGGFTDDLRELAPHYLIVVLLIFGGLILVDVLYDDVGFIWRAAVAVAIGLAYPLVLRQLDMAPEPWQ